MTRTPVRRAPYTAARADLRVLNIAWIAAAAGGLTLLIRLALHTAAFDLFGDEVLYTDLGHSVVNGGFPQFGGPFFLHGPGFFYLEAGWQRLLGNQPSVIGGVYEMRMLNALLAAATAVVLVLLAARAGSLRAAAAAGFLFALDPFCIRQNDRVLLETALMLWVMLGYLVFTSLIARQSSRRDWIRAVGAGLLFGCAVLTKDEGALLTVLPLLVAAVLRWGPRRSLTLLTVGTTIAVYAIYLAVVAVNGYFGVVWQSKTAGIQRMLGMIQSTGFHSSGGGSLTARLVAEGAYFATTYLALAVAIPAFLVILRRGGQLSRMLGLLYCAAAVTLAYAVFHGTLEEQELYLLIVPSLLIIPVAAAHLGNTLRVREKHVAAGKYGKALTMVLAAALVLTLGINLRTSLVWLRQPDDGFARLTQYMTTHVPPGSRVGVLDVDIETPYALGSRYNVGVWQTPAALSQNHVRYLVVEWGPLDEGYSDQSPAQVQQLVSHSRLVFSFRERTYGQLAFYLLPVPPAGNG